MKNKLEDNIECPLINEIKSLKRQLSLTYGTFNSEKEVKAFNKFCKKHQKCERNSRSNAGKAPYIVPTYTGVGIINKVVCQICGESEDITDVGAW